jgi:ABC-type thiamin/hydroxymethylpyrimidine transport system permease subunit
MEKNTTQPLDIIKAGIIAGLTIEIAFFIYREQRYKNIFKYMMKYPGVSVATFSVIFGMGCMYLNYFKK